MTERNLFFWIFMLCMNVLVPLVMIGFGYYFKRKVPEEINEVFGYRTTMSMKNNETWKFAHHYAGNLWLYFGVVLLPITIVAMLFVYGQDIDAIGSYAVNIMFFQLVPLCAVIIPQRNMHYEKNLIKKEI